MYPRGDYYDRAYMSERSRETEFARERRYPAPPQFEGSRFPDHDDRWVRRYPDDYYGPPPPMRGEVGYPPAPYMGRPMPSYPPERRYPEAYEDCDYARYQQRERIVVERVYSKYPSDKKDFGEDHSFDERRVVYPVEKPSGSEKRPSEYELYEKSRYKKVSKRKRGDASSKTRIEKSRSKRHRRSISSSRKSSSSGRKRKRESRKKKKRHRSSSSRSSLSSESSSSGSSSRSSSSDSHKSKKDNEKKLKRPKTIKSVSKITDSSAIKDYIAIKNKIKSIKEAQTNKNDKEKTAAKPILPSKPVIQNVKEDDNSDIDSGSESTLIKIDRVVSSKLLSKKNDSLSEGKDENKMNDKNFALSKSNSGKSQLFKIEKPPVENKLTKKVHPLFDADGSTDEDKSGDEQLNPVINSEQSENQEEKNVDSKSEAEPIKKNEFLKLIPPPPKISSRTTNLPQTKSKNENLDDSTNTKVGPNQGKKLTKKSLNDLSYDKYGLFDNVTSLPTSKENKSDLSNPTSETFHNSPGFNHHNSPLASKITDNLPKEKSLLLKPPPLPNFSVAKAKPLIPNLNQPPPGFKTLNPPPIPVDFSVPPPKIPMLPKPPLPPTLYPSLKPNITPSQNAQSVNSTLGNHPPLHSQTSTTIPNINRFPITSELPTAVYSQPPPVISSLKHTQTLIATSASKDISSTPELSNNSSSNADVDLRIINNNPSSAVSLCNAILSTKFPAKKTHSTKKTHDYYDPLNPLNSDSESDFEDPPLPICPPPPSFSKPELSWMKNEQMKKKQIDKEMQVKLDEEKKAKKLDKDERNKLEENASDNDWSNDEDEETILPIIEKKTNTLVDRINEVSIQDKEDADIALKVLSSLSKQVIDFFVSKDLEQHVKELEDYEMIINEVSDLFKKCDQN